MLLSSRRIVFSGGCGVCALTAGVFLSHTVAYIGFGIGLVAIALSIRVVAERLPTVTLRHVDGFHLSVHPPMRLGPRSLYRRTEALLNDWHRFQASMWRPDSETYDHVEEMKRRDREELAFRERVSKLEGEYIRRGRLEELTDFTGAQLPSEAAIRADPLTPAVLRLERLANPVE